MVLDNQMVIMAEHVLGLLHSTAVKVMIIPVLYGVYHCQEAKK
ncbi:hypothetical protein [Alicyclobacillus sp. SO9]|nr:hypothetical protein [Alicyclobacillus sp. SO9]